ncbi:MAG TPA: TolC family protein [Myxococcota bacterium]
MDVVVGVQQAFDVTGERDARGRAADAGVVFADADIDEVRWRVHADVHALFHDVVIAGARVAVAEDALAFQQQLQQIVVTRIAVGDLPAYSRALADIDVLAATNDVVAARQQQRRSALDLAAIVGWPAGHVPLPDDHREHPQQPPALSTLLTAARAQHPALKALSARVQAARAAVVVEDRAFGLSPVLGAQLTQEGNPPSQGGANWIGLVSVQVPVPSFQRNQGAQAQARAELAVAEATLAAAQARLDHDVARAHSEVVAAVARVDAWGGEIVEKSRTHLQVLKRAFELGEIDLLALGAGRERLLQAQRTALDARRDAFVAGADLERVVGRELFDDDGHVSIPDDDHTDGHDHSEVH